MSSWFNFSPRSVDTYLRGGEIGSLDDERRINSSSTSSSVSSRQHGGGAWIGGGHKSTDASDVFFTPTASSTSGASSRVREDSYRSWSSSLESSVQERIEANRNALRSVAHMKSPNQSSSSVFEVQTYLTSRSMAPPSMCGLSPSIISPRRVTKFQPISGSTRRLANDLAAKNFSLEIDLKMPSNFRGSVSITTDERSSLESAAAAAAAASAAPASANLHHRRESFLYRSTADNNDLAEASPKWHATNTAREQNHSEDFVVTPFAQILQTLRRVRNNYMIIANLPSTCSRSRRTPDRDDLYGSIRPSKAANISEDQRRQLAIITLDDLEWSLEQLENIQIHKSVGDLATSKFRRLLSRELNQFAEATKAGSQVSDYICNTFLDIPKDIDLPVLKSEDGAATPQHMTPPVVEDHRKQMSIISGVHTSNPDVSSCCLDSSEIPKYRVKVNEEDGVDELMDGINSWGVDIFRIKELTNSRPLTSMTYTVLKERNLLAEFSIPEATLINYLTQLERHYRSDVSYHNSIHAADVMQSSHYLVSVPALQDVFSSLEILAVIFGAAIHDVDHPGLTNQYLVNSNAELAIMYNDSSVLENHHLALAFKLLQSEGCDIFCNLSAKTRQSLRRMIIDVVLATDMSKHMSLLADLKTMVETKTLAGSDVIQLDSYNDRIMVLQNLVHCSDLSNPTKPLPLYRKWTDRIMEEFFRQGDLEKELGLDISPMCDRLTATVEKSQIGFIDYVVHPLWETWADLVYPDCQGILDTLEDNRQWYQSQIIADSVPPDAEAPEAEAEQPTSDTEVTLTVDAEVTSFPTLEYVPVTSDVFVEETLPLTLDRVFLSSVVEATQSDAEATSRETTRVKVSGHPLRCPLNSSRRTSRDLTAGGGGQSESR